MVYVYAKKTELQKYLKKELTTEEIKESLIELGMDLKGESYKSDKNEVSSMDLKGEKVTEPFSKEDPELKIEITAEKLDMISTCGIARAINFQQGFLKELPKYTLEKSDLEVHVKEQVNKVRPKTVCCLIKNAPMNQELLDEIIAIQEKIHDSFGRNRKKAAIGIYPMDKITFPITFTAEKPEEIVFQPLEAKKEMHGKQILNEHDTGKKFAHLLDGKEVFPIFRDAQNKVLSMPPVINSHDTGRVDSKHKDLFVEISGHNLTHLDNILKVLATTFIELGCKVESMKVKYPKNEIYELSLDSTTDTISLDYVNKLIGIDLNEEQIKELLPKVQFGCKAIKDGEIIVEIPCYKSDVWYDCDIADDIARAYGYNNIVPRFPNVDSIGEEHDHTYFKNQIRNQLISLGFIELYTYMLSSTKEQFEMMGNKEEEHVSILDSAEEGINMLRTTILPENLKALTINRKNKYPQKVFECGFTIKKDLNTETKAKDELHLCVSVADPSSNFTKIKEIIDTIAILNKWDISFKESENKTYIEGRQASILINGKEVGFVGEIHPQVLENNNLIVPISSFEINLEKIISN